MASRSAASPPATLTADESGLGPATDVVAPRPRSVEIGFLFAAIGAILFSTKGIAIKLAYAEGVDAETLLALRMGLSVPVYLAIGALSLRDRDRQGRPLPGRRTLVAAALVGLLGYWVASYTDFLGLEYISAQFERLILFTYPLFVVLFGFWFFGQPIRPAVIGAVALSYGGLALIFTFNAPTMGGDLLIGGGLVLVAAIAFALYQLLAKPLIAAIGPRLFTCIAMLAAAVGAILQFFVTHPPSDLAVSPKVWAYGLYLAVGATVLPSFFMSAALHRISAQANAAIGTLSPVATIIMAWAILGEDLSLIELAGAALVVAGIGWLTLRDRK